MGIDLNARKPTYYILNGAVCSHFVKILCLFCFLAIMWAKETARISSDGRRLDGMFIFLFFSLVKMSVQKLIWIYQGEQCRYQGSQKDKKKCYYIIYTLNLNQWESLKFSENSMNISKYSTNEFFQWCYIGWNFVNFHWISENLTDSNLECT